VWEEDAFPLARRLAAEEGLFVGMSSGAIAFAALRVACELGAGKRVAWISPDSGARYLSTTLFSGDAMPDERVGELERSVPREMPNRPTAFSPRSQHPSTP